MECKIRAAEPRDTAALGKLLYQVHKVHSDGRPDLFLDGRKKYTDEELLQLMQDGQTPIFVAVDEADTVLGYAFCVLSEIKDHPSLTSRRELYVDDLCVDEACRGQHIGTALYRFVCEYAKQQGCYHVTLNVWCLNEGAMHFYQRCGMSPMKIVMEQILP